MHLSEELLKQEEISEGNWKLVLPGFLYVLSATRLRWRIEFVQIGYYKGKRVVK